jgi:hypothetical protein
MNKLTLLPLAFACAGTAQAALPPQYQNMKDLEVMVDYVRQHPEVAAGLRSIDMGDKTIYYGHDCKAVFGRKSIPRPPGWVGPADPLEPKDTRCPDR